MNQTAWSQCPRLPNERTSWYWGEDPVRGCHVEGLVQSLAHSRCSIMLAVVMFIYGRQAGDVAKKRGLTEVSGFPEINQEPQQ